MRLLSLAMASIATLLLCAAAPAPTAQTKVEPKEEMVSRKQANLEILAAKQAQKTADENGQASADLKAQQSMALWAMMMFIAAVLQFILAIAGTVGIFRTLHWTRKSAEEAQRSATASITAAEAAVEAGRVTEVAARDNADIMRKQLRAYVGIANATVTHIGISLKPTVEISMENTGATPAIRYIGQGSIQIGPANLKPNFIPVNFINGARSTLNTPTKLELTLEQALNQQEVANLNNGISALFVCVDFAYEDVFGQQHTDRLEFKSAPSFNGKLALRPA